MVRRRPAFRPAKETARGRNGPPPSEEDREGTARANEPCSRANGSSSLGEKGRSVREQAPLQDRFRESPATGRAGVEFGAGGVVVPENQLPVEGKIGGGDKEIRVVTGEYFSRDGGGHEGLAAG